jgi:hypothetical protein
MKNKRRLLKEVNLHWMRIKEEAGDKDDFLVREATTPAYMPQ